MGPRFRAKVRIKVRMTGQALPDFCPPPSPPLRRVILTCDLPLPAVFSREFVRRCLRLASNGTQPPQLPQDASQLRVRCHHPRKSSAPIGAPRIRRSPECPQVARIKAFIPIRGDMALPRSSVPAMSAPQSGGVLRQRVQPGPLATSALISIRSEKSRVPGAIRRCQTGSTQ